MSPTLTKDPRELRIVKGKLVDLVTKQSVEAQPVGSPRVMYYVEGTAAASSETVAERVKNDKVRSKLIQRANAYVVSRAVGEIGANIVHDNKTEAFYLFFAVQYYRISPKSLESLKA